MLEKEIAKGIKQGLDDLELNIRIQVFISGDYYFGEQTTVNQWRIDNYARLREWLYETRDTVHRDATGKINDPDGDTAIITEGQSELAAYYEWRKYNVKARFPKE